MNNTIRITFKHPDAVDAAKYDFHHANEEEYSQLSEDEMDAFTDKLDNALYKFIRGGEYVTIEINIDDGTATVVPNKGYV
jgi:ABC-type amino acid transport substrate-binding protein